MAAVDPDTEARAALAAARVRVNQASNQIRKASSAIAQADQGFYAAAVVRVTDAHGIQVAAERIELELAEAGAIDVVVLIAGRHEDPGPSQGPQTKENRT